MRANTTDINRVFNDLDDFLAFCKEFGYVFRKEDLYKMNTPWGSYVTWKHKGRVQDNWAIDYERYRNLA